MTKGGAGLLDTILCADSTPHGRIGIDAKIKGKIRP